MVPYGNLPDRGFWVLHVLCILTVHEQIFYFHGTLVLHARAEGMVAATTDPPDHAPRTHPCFRAGFRARAADLHGILEPMTLPPPLSWLWSAWKMFSEVLGKIMSKIILTILWIVGFGTYAIVLTFFRLFRRKSPPPASYWIDVPPAPPKNLHHQF